MRVLIVGAGPAGAATALLLARRGVDVTLVERERDFDRVFRGEALMPSGLDALHQMGLREKLNALPWRYLESWDIYLERRQVMCIEEPVAELGDLALRVVGQPRLLELLVAEAARFPTFTFRSPASVRNLLRNGSGVCGVKVAAPHGEEEIRADLTIGTDGRSSLVRTRAGLELDLLPESYDVLWFKAPIPERLEHRCPLMIFASGPEVALAYVSWDGSLHVAWLMDKGQWGELKRRDWLADVMRLLPEWLADHFDTHRREIETPRPFDVIVGRCPRWSAPGLLLLGDAAHPMSPVRAQGINIALRDAIVAANHLVPALLAGRAPESVLEAIQRERDPEIIRAQHLPTADCGPPLQCVDRFDHPEADRVEAVGSDAIEMTNEERAEALHLGEPLPAQRVHPADEKVPQPMYRGRRFRRVRSHSVKKACSARRALPQLTRCRTAAWLVGIDWQSRPICWRKRRVTRAFGLANSIRSVRTPQWRQITRRCR